MLSNLARLPPRLSRASPFSPQTTSSPGSPAPTSASIVPHLLKGPRGAPRTAAILTTLGWPTAVNTPFPQPSGPSNAAKLPGRSRGWPLSMVAYGGVSVSEEQTTTRDIHASGDNMAGNQGVKTGGGSRSQGGQDSPGNGF